MDQKIVSAINSALFHQKALAHIRIMNAKRNAKGTITVMAHPNTTAYIAMQFRDIIMAARTVDRGVLDVEEKETCERLKLHVVPLVQYMGKGTDGLKEMRGKFKADSPPKYGGWRTPAPSGRGGRTERSPHHRLSLL